MILFSSGITVSLYSVLHSYYNIGYYIGVLTITLGLIFSWNQLVEYTALLTGMNCLVTYSVSC